MQQSSDNIWLTDRAFKGRYQTELYKAGNETRLPLPSVYQDLLQNGGVVTVGMDENLLLFSAKHWELITENLARQAGSIPGSAPMVRHIYGRQLAFDSLNDDGSVTLSDDLVGYAGLNQKILLVGMIYYAEVHHAERYYDQMLSSAEAKELATALRSL